MGRDKLKMDDREKFTDSIIDLVKRCANDPILNREWQETED
jgi:DNA-directed RNA polymerase